MNYHNEIQVGDTAEQKFISLALARGYQAVESSFQQDVHQHIDVFLQKGGKTFSFDIKAMKKLNRHDESAQDQYAFVELKNVRGNKGWLYGDAQFIVFERMNCFLVVQRKGLAEYCKTVIQREYVYRPQDALYKFYRRNGRNDLITMVDLDKIPNDIKFTWMGGGVGESQRAVTP